MRTSDLHIRRISLDPPRWLLALNGPNMSAVLGGAIVVLAVYLGLTGL